jgi:hypothetical protein
MAIVNFVANSEVGLDRIQDDFLAKADADVAAGLRTDTLDDDDATKEDNMVLALAYELVKVLRARQINALANDRDRVFGRWVGGEAQYAFYRLIEMIEPVYAEFYAAANGVDDVADDPFAAGYGTNDVTATPPTAPAGGPVS